MLRLNIRSCGSFARRSLDIHPAARVQGSISKGIFLLFPDRKVAFLSFQVYGGPLNLTLQHPPNAPLPIQIGDEALVSENEIRFPASGIILDLRTARPWAAAPPPPQADNGIEYLNHLARRVYAARPEDGWAALLPHLLGWGESSPSLPQSLENPLACLRAARSSLRSGDPQTALPALLELIGLGRGLTPSGDDCLSGLLLARSRARLAGTADPDPLAAPLIQAAYERTTAISANILEAAAAGESEQRLLAACDALLSGQVDDPPQVLDGLLAYGSSSGLDTLVGMTVALTVPA